MVKSENTRNLTDMEKKELEKSLMQLSKKKLNQFRKEFNPNAMGFVGREEGI